MIELINGKTHDFLNPSEPDINVIAHSLANLNRWCGHTSKPFSVAQHSVLVSYLVPKCYALEALLHDAPEAYLGDVASPLKKLLPDYTRLEEIQWEAVCAKFGTPQVLHPEVVHADKVALCLENEMLREGNDMGLKVTAIHRAAWLHVPDYDNGKQAFLARFKELWA